MAASTPRLVKPKVLPEVCLSCPRTRGIHKHKDGSHWCNLCGGYIGTAGKDFDHPEKCECVQMDCPMGKRK